MLHLQITLYTITGLTVLKN